MIRTDNVESPVNLRPACKADLGKINEIIGRAVQTWRLPERVKRLVMPTYHYTEHDFEHLHIVVAEDREAGILGVAGWESAAASDCPDGQRALLLHGLYVDPVQQRRGIGTRLLQAAVAAAREQGYDGLLVKAQADAEGFFSSQGLQRVVVADEDRDYPNRFWLDLAS
jgi:GNAT superfamily N-acetyltransferase